MAAVTTADARTEETPYPHPMTAVQLSRLRLGVEKM